VTDASLIRVANTPNTQFLLQRELRAIQQGLKYIEVEVDDITYKGYVNKDGLREGVGMRIWSDGYKEYAEWHLNKPQGCIKMELANGNSYWGEFKDGKCEGYGTWEVPNGNRYIG
jgi:MORN repeat